MVTGGPRANDKRGVIDSLKAMRDAKGNVEVGQEVCAIAGHDGGGYRRTKQERKALAHSFTFP
jgi:hypothetical protein